MAASVNVYLDHCDPSEVFLECAPPDTRWLRIGPVVVFLTPELLAAIHAATCEDVSDRE